MSEFNFQRPFDPASVKEANDIFYYYHPEMILQGQRQPIYPLDPKHRDYRDEWEYYYVKSGGKIKSKEPFVDTSDVDSNTIGQCQKEKKLAIVDLLYIPYTKMLYPLTMDDMLEIEQEEEKMNDIIRPLALARERGDVKVLNDAKKEVQEAFVALGFDKMVKAVASGGSVNGITEAIRYRGKNYTYIRSDKIKNHWRGYKAETEVDLKKEKQKAKNVSAHFSEKDKKKSWKEKASQKAIDDLLKGLKETTIEYEWKVPDNIIDNSFYRWANTFSTQRKAEWIVVDKDFLNDPNRHFDASAECQLMRFVMGASIKSEFQPMKGKFHLNAKAKSDFALAEAQARAEGFLPNKGGYPLKFDMPLKESKETREIDLGNIRVNYDFVLYGYAGASVALGLSTHFDMSDGVMKICAKSPKDKNKKNKSKYRTMTQRASAGAEGEFFAGVKAGCKVGAKLQWSNPENDYDFNELAECGYDISVSAGGGGAVNFQFKYDDKTRKFYLRCKAELVLGVGASGEAKFVVNGKNILIFIQFIYQALRDRDFDYLELIEPHAFKILNLILIKHMLEYQILEYIVENTLDHIESWWDDFNKDRLEAEKLALYILKSPEIDVLKYSPPETKGEILSILSVGFFNSLEEKQEDAIIKVLEWIQSKRDYREVLEHMPLNVSGDVLYDAKEAELQLLYILDFSQNGTFLKWRNDLPDEAISVGNVSKRYYRK